VPSTFFTTDKAKKEELFGQHQDKLRRIPCKHFNYGKGLCKYGINCHYAHTDESGHPMASTPPNGNTRTLIGSDGGVRHYSDLTLTLGSFLEIAERTKR